MSRSPRFSSPLAGTPTTQGGKTVFDYFSAVATVFPSAVSQRMGCKTPWLGDALQIHSSDKLIAMVDSPSVTPRVFLSYSHDSAEHRQNIADFAQQLRLHGIDARLDQFVENQPPLSWPRWMTDEIKTADFVLLVFTENYARRFEGKEQVGHGLGSAWEGSIITSEIYFNVTDRVKFIPVVIESGNARLISDPLSLTTFYEVGTPQNRNLDKLLRHIHRQPALIPAELGTIPQIGAPEETNFAASPTGETIQIALDLAEAGDADAAEMTLLPLLESGSPRDAAYAAYYIGKVRLHSEQYAAAINALQCALELNADSLVNQMASADLADTLSMMNAHYGEGSAVAAAREYFDLAKKGKIEELWLRTEPTLRLVLAQAWVFANQEHPALAGFEHEQLATDLADLTIPCPLQEDFFSTQLREMQDSFQNFDAEQWGAAERPRRFGLDYELVIFMETGGDILIFQNGMSPPTIPLLMRRIGPNWKVANFHASYPIPGWPPGVEPLPGLDVDFRSASEKWRHRQCIAATTGPDVHRPR